MDSSLLEFLQQNLSEFHEKNDDTYTHISLYGPHSKWFIDNSRLNDFWTLYCRLVEKKSTHLYLAEIAEDIMPVISVCTFKFHTDATSSITKETSDDSSSDSDTEEREKKLKKSPKSSEKQSSPKKYQKKDFNKHSYVSGDFDLSSCNEFILHFIQCYQDILVDLLHLGEKQNELNCVVLISGNWIEDNILSVQLRIQFPYCKTATEVQTRLIRPRLIYSLRQRNVLSKLEIMPLNDWETILDPLAHQESVLLYGSRMNKNRPPLKLEYIQGILEKKHFENNRGHPKELDEIFSVENHSHVYNNFISQDMFDGEPLEKWLPLFLSIHYWNKQTMAKNKASLTPISMRPKLTTPSTLGTDTNESNIEIAQKLISMLKTERAGIEEEWLNVGKALHNASNGSDEGLELWKRFTARDDQFSEKGCKLYYKKFRDEPITFKTLAWYAKQDSPDSYNKWHSKWCEKAYKLATSGSHADVAQALYRVYWLDYKCSSLHRKQLWEFRNHRWVKLDHGFTLRKHITGDFLTIIERYLADIANQVANSSDPDFKETGNVLTKKLTKLISLLKSQGFENSIMDSVCKYFYDERFDRLIDENENLLGIIDGVIVATPKECYHREGKPEDYITKCAGVYYDSTYDDNHPNVKALDELSDKIFPDPTLKHYYYKLAASCLRGKNSFKIFPIWTGGTNGGKSVTGKLFETTFGDYCTKLDMAVVTSKPNSANAPSPQLAQTRGGRVTFLEEPDDDDVLRGGTVKRFTGGDSFYARMLNENGGKIQAMTKVFLICNNIPNFTSSGDAMVGRVRILPFLSIFVDDPPEDEDEQREQRRFKKDEYFENKIPELAIAFLWKLVQYYPILVKEQLKPPAIVEEHTKDYWESNDPYRCFRREVITEARTEDNKIDKDSYLSVREVYQQFKLWFTDSRPGTKPPTQALFQAEFSKILPGNPTRGVWRGYKFNEESGNQAPDI